jgi:peptide/nickel transport system ATP-binding protein
MALLEVRELASYYRFPRGIADVVRRRDAVEVRAVDDVSFTLDRHEMLALVGESGCGKTTTVQTILRLYDPVGGRVEFGGRDITMLGQREIRPIRKRMQIIYQDPYESLNPRFRVRQTLEEPLKIHGIGSSAKERSRLVLEALERVDLRPPGNFVERYPHELSGGQRQRVAIAAALVVNPELLVADEPVSMLDVSIRAGVMALLRRLCTEDGMGILMITHDLALAAHFADRIAVMYLGRIVEIGETREVLRNPQHPYTRALRDIAPRRWSGGTAKPARILRGEPASAASMPSGCRFHPRCPMAQAECMTEDPGLHQSGTSTAGHEVACLLAP